MLTSDPLVAAPEAVAAAKTYLRIENTDDDAAITSFVVAAVAQCEAFTGTVLVERGFVERLDADYCWRSLAARPATSVGLVTDDTGAALATPSFAIDIDTHGTAMVRLVAGGAGRIRVTYRAGLVTGWALLAEPLKLGIVRLVAHYYAGRDGTSDAGAPPAITNMWRSARRSRLA